MWIQVNICSLITVYWWQYRTHRDLLPTHMHFCQNWFWNMWYISYLLFNVFLSAKIFKTTLFLIHGFVKADSQICDIFHIYYLSISYLLKHLKRLYFSSTVLSKLILKSVIYFIFSTCSFFHLLKHLKRICFSSTVLAVRVVTFNILNCKRSVEKFAHARIQ